MGLIAALLFAAHPLATQAVTYLIQRTTSLCALFELAAVACSLTARRIGRARWWLGAGAAALLAAFTKEMSVALPLLLIVVHAAWGRAGSHSSRERMPWWRLAPFTLVVPLVAWVAQLTQGKTGRAVTGLRETTDIGRLEYLWTQLTVTPRYLALVVWPHGQNLDPDVALRSQPDVTVWLGALLLVALTAGAAAVARRAPLVAAGWCWCLVALMPESSVFPIRDVMVEHRMYLPLAGLVWIAAWGLSRLPMKRESIALTVVALVLTLAIVTQVRNRVWRDELTLWADVVSKSPRLPRGWNNLAMQLDARGRAREAESAFRRAMELDPNHVYARVNLGRLYGMHGRLREALDVLLEAARLAPYDATVLNKLGTTWWALGDSARALATYDEAFVAAPASPEVRMNRDRLLAALGPRAPMDTAGAG